MLVSFTKCTTPDVPVNTDRISLVYICYGVEDELPSIKIVFSTEDKGTVKFDFEYISDCRQAYCDLLRLMNHHEI